MRVTILRLIGLIVAGLSLQPPAVASQVYAGLCDASAAIAIDASHFLVAEDENDLLWLYRNDGTERAPVRRFDFTSRLRADPDRESDIEGAARIGDRVYWITSHGRNSKGKLRENRYRLFATNIAGPSKNLKLTWVGRYDHLIRDMLNAQTWSNPNVQDTLRTIKILARATRPDKKKVPELAPKKEGLNIEALAALPDGSGLLIGLRNPIPGGSALIIHVQNPKALVEGQDARARFGPPFYLNLHGLGLRAMAYAPNMQKFLLVAGPPKSGGSFKLFRWDGTQAAAPVLIGDLQSSEGSHPEAVVVYPNKEQIQILHDEGSKVVDKTACKDTPKEKDKRFSDRWYVVE